MQIQKIPVSLQVFLKDCRVIIGPDPEKIGKLGNSVSRLQRIPTEHNKNDVITSSVSPNKVVSRTKYVSGQTVDGLALYCLISAISHLGQS